MDSSHDIAVAEGNIFAETVASTSHSGSYVTNHRGFAHINVNVVKAEPIEQKTDAPILNEQDLTNEPDRTRKSRRVLSIIQMYEVH